MSPQPHDGAAEERLSSSILRLVDDPERIESLRQMLRSFNHQCRNSLNGIKMSLYLFKHEVDGPMPGCWFELERTYQELERLFDRLQVISRPLSLTLVRSPLGQLVNERLPLWRSWFSLRGRTFEVDTPGDDLPGDFDPMYLGLGLDAFVAWRAEAGHARWQAHLSWEIADGFFEVTWEEVRPTNTVLRHDREVGQAEASRPRPDGRVDALAYPLLARIVSAHGGDLQAAGDPALVMRLRWPRYQVCGQAK
jgi:hypothetical protein